ncbi:MAG: heavy-metal-associated domain-containing protein [Vicinamibacterales bacterium]
MTSETKDLIVQGMSCGGCVKAVTRVLAGLDGVTPEEVAVGRARISLDPQRTSMTTVREALAASGYAAEEVER